MRAARPWFALAAALWLAALGRDGFDRWVDATVLPPLKPQTSVEVVDRNGTLLRAFTVEDGRWRLAVDAGAVDPGYLALLVAYEDRRFYSHGGVDARAMARAVAQAVWNGRVISGGSTLTMQVARLLEGSGTGQVAGKLRQMRLAWALERRLTKDEILALYLQVAPFGGNLEGVRSATLAYYGKEPRRLTRTEAALMVAIPQSPEARRPDRHPAQATAARARVLDRAVAAGLVDAAQTAAALTEGGPTARRPVPALAPHLADRLRTANPAQTRHTVKLDAALQQRIEALAADAVAGRGEAVQVAIVVADHLTGEILASVGSAAYRGGARQGFVDMTTALRSPGSTIKPLIYALAFDEGLAHPETLVEDTPTRFGRYAPENFDRTYHGTIRARQALQLSLNIPAVALTEAIGPARLMAALRRAGVQAVVPDGGEPGLAVALGGLGISLTDMVQLYAGLARGGVAVPLRVTEPGPGEGARLVSEVAAWQVGDILSGLAPPPGAPENRLAYKTGTSYGHRDAWAIGFDGRHVIGVWMGRADGTPMPGAFGGDLAAPVLFQAFNRLKPQLDPLPPPPPTTLLVSTAQLPPPLQRFRLRTAAFLPANAPSVAFPPDGAEVELVEGYLLVRVAGGAAPFTWLADGVPAAVAQSGRDALLRLAEEGFVTLSVIDAAGQSARARVRLLLP
jgi:penicillin-binding protein 1C